MLMIPKIKIEYSYRTIYNVCWYRFQVERFLNVKIVDDNNFPTIA